MAEEITFSVDTTTSNLGFIFGLDSQQFIYYKSALPLILGLSDKELTVGNVLSKVHPDDVEHLQELKTKLQLGEDVAGADFRIISKEKEKWLHISGFMAKVESEKVLAGQVTEISAEVENVHTLRKFANKKNSVLNIIAHDLRGPLGTANMLTEVLDKEAKEADLVKYIRPVSRIIKQSIDLITDLIEREFLETIEVALVKKRIDVVTKLREWMEEFTSSEWTAQRTFAFSSSHAQIFAEIDEAKFIQIVNNLVTNSLKFTREGDRISLDIRAEKEVLLISFSDTGIGIPKEHHNTLFEKFTNARRKGLNGEPTVGLGLSIVKTIVEWHKGRIWFQSEENKGSTFYVEIPRTTNKRLKRN